MTLEQRAAEYAEKAADFGQAKWCRQDWLAGYKAAIADAIAIVQEALEQEWSGMADEIIRRIANGREEVERGK